eukprot:gene15736-7031_t
MQHILYMLPRFADGASVRENNRLNRILPALDSFYGYLFPDNQEAAFSNYKLWESLGFVIAFANSGAICVSTKLYILIAVLIVAITLYGVIERMEHKKRKTMSYIPPKQAIESVEELL